MSIQDFNKRKIPIIKIDQSLTGLKDMGHFKGKIEKANQAIKKMGLPQVKRQS